MKHLDDGTLRRIHDDSLTVNLSHRLHLDSCARCRSRACSVAEDAREVERAMTTSTTAPNTGAALLRLRTRIESEGVTPSAPWMGRLRALVASRRWIRPAGGLAAAAVLVGSLTFSPAGALADRFLSVFQPTQVVVVPVSIRDLQSLPDLRKFGTIHAPKRLPSSAVANYATASTLARLQIMQPGSLPSGVPHVIRYTVLPGNVATFTFSAAKARRVAESQGKVLPAMPASIDGSTLQVRTSAAVIATYGPTGRESIPALVIGQMRAPRILSTGASVQAVENYILSLPGVSPSLASSIRAIGNPSSVLPIPIPVDVAHAHSVTVQGVSGTAIGDSTGLGSVVIWQKNGVLYGVGGALTEDQVLGVAGSLH